MANASEYKTVQCERCGADTRTLKHIVRKKYCRTCAFIRNCESRWHSEDMRGKLTQDELCETNRRGALSRHERTRLAWELEKNPSMTDVQIWEFVTRDVSPISPEPANVRHPNELPNLHIRSRIEMQAQVTLDVSDSGKIVKLVLQSNGRLVAELLVHGPLKATLENCLRDAPILKGRPNVFRAEVWGLAGYEVLDTDTETVREK